MTSLKTPVWKTRLLFFMAWWIFTNGNSKSAKSAKESMPSYNHLEKQADAKPGGLLAWEAVLNSTQDHTLTISRMNAFWTTRNEELEPNRRENVFDSIDTFSPRLGWRDHKLILTRPPNKLACVKSGSGSHSYQGKGNLLSAIRLIQNP